jgi:hypothetical protein
MGNYRGLEGRELLFTVPGSQFQVRVQFGFVFGVRFSVRFIVPGSVRVPFRRPARFRHSGSVGLQPQIPMIEFGSKVPATGVGPAVALFAIRARNQWFDFCDLACWRCRLAGGSLMAL